MSSVVLLSTPSLVRNSADGVAVPINAVSARRSLPSRAGRQAHEGVGQDAGRVTGGTLRLWHR